MHDTLEYNHSLFILIIIEEAASVDRMFGCAKSHNFMSVIVMNEMV